MIEPQLIADINLQMCWYVVYDLFLYHHHVQVVNLKITLLTHFCVPRTFFFLWRSYFVIGICPNSLLTT